nr:MFS transporter [Candidatus Sigynarchaeum springense]
MRNISYSILSIGLFLCILIVAIVYAIQNLISPALKEISQYFGFGTNTSQLGVLTSAFTILGGGSMLIFGYLADKSARVKKLFVGTVIFSVSATCTIFIPEQLPGYVIFFMLQLVCGFGFGMIIPNTFSLIGDLIAQKDRSKGFSFFSIATLIGTAIGNLFGTMFSQIDWRLSYAFLGIAGLAGSLMLLLVKEPNRIGRDRLFLVDKTSREYSYKIQLVDLKAIIKKKSNFWLIVNFVDNVPTSIILFLLYNYLFYVHGVPNGFGLIFLVFVLISTLAGTVIFGYIGDKRFQMGDKKARVKLALFANIAPIPFVFTAFLIPFKLPTDGSLLDLFMIPGAVLMLVLLVIGLFLNGATNGSWYATVVDINLPEHRGTVLATANFFDIIGRSLGPLIAPFITDLTYASTGDNTISYLIGISSSIIAWLFLPFFWIGVIRNVLPDMEATDAIFNARLDELRIRA